jgi:aminopeptidase N
MDETYLLPKTLMPTQYTIALIPYFNTNTPAPEKVFTFDGTVTITLTCIEATDKIIMHAFDIKIEDKSKVVVVTKGSTDALAVKSIEFTDQVKDGKQFFTIMMEQPLEAGSEYDVTIEYQGNLNEDLEGFYRSFYMEGGEKK